MISLSLGHLLLVLYVEMKGGQVTSQSCLKRLWPLPDITPFSRMQKIELTGASDLALVFLHQRCFCIYVHKQPVLFVV